VVELAVGDHVPLRREENLPSDHHLGRLHHDADEDLPSRVLADKLFPVIGAAR